MIQCVMSCVNGSSTSYSTEEKRAIALREILTFVRKQDHEGSSWSVEEDGLDITPEIEVLLGRMSAEA